MDLPTILAGFLVGITVGLTGVGGGSLMTPVLVLLFGTAPATAVGTDLWFSAITKSVGGIAHHRQGTVDWQVFWRMSAGSIPAAIGTLIWMSRSHVVQRHPTLLIHALGAVLLAAAAAMLLRGRIQSVALRMSERSDRIVTLLQPPLTIVAGALLGATVALTSVGAGALGAAMLVYLHPTRMNSTRLAGTDMAYGVPLALVAASGHFVLGDVQWPLLANLLIGSVPGVIVGSVVSSRSPEALLRGVVTLLLLGVSVRLMMS